MGNKNRKKAVALLAVAICCAFAAFYALFVAGVDHWLAAGAMILGFVGFALFFNKAFDLWSPDGESAAQE